MNEAAAHAMQYLAVTDAMGYQAGPGLLSPEEYAAELRKDAERYSWLRAQNWNTSLLAVVADPKDAIKLGHDCPSLARLDEQIDAAMLAQRAVGAV